MVEGGEQYGRTYIVPDLLAHILHLLADPEGKNEVRGISVTRRWTLLTAGLHPLQVH